MSASRLSKIGAQFLKVDLEMKHKFGAIMWYNMQCGAQQNDFSECMSGT
jgi:hypothetical protein